MPSNVYSFLNFFFQAKEREIELKNEWSNNRMSRKQTQAKYGFWKQQWKWIHTLSLCVVTCTQSCIQGEQILGWSNNFITFITWQQYRRIFQNISHETASLCFECILYIICLCKDKIKIIWITYITRSFLFFLMIIYKQNIVFAYL